MKPKIEDIDYEELTRFIYNISRRMLFVKQDAEDATQEIIVKILEKYEKFNGNSSIKTWAYRVAINHLINIKNNKFNKITFEEFTEDIKVIHPENEYSGLSKIEEKIYIEELKISCTFALLQCLEKESRLIFILGNIFSIESKIGGEIFEITSSTYRKKLSRANKKITSFMNSNCGLVNKKAICKCKKRLNVAFEKERIGKEKTFYEKTSISIEEFKKSMNQIDRISQVYKSNPYYKIPETLKKNLINIIENGKYEILRV